MFSFVDHSLFRYSTSAVRRTSISFGMRENKDFKGTHGESGESDSGMEDGEDTASSASMSVSSLPSLNDVDADLSAMHLNEVAM